MKFSGQRETLAYHLLSRPLMSRMDFGGVPAKSVGQCAKKYHDQGVVVSPESEALRFYLSHQVMAAVRKRRRLHEPLPAEELALVERSIREGNDVFLRMMYYVAVICLRECRHIHDGDQIKVKANGKPFYSAIDFVTHIPDSPNEAMNVFLNKVPEELTLLQMGEAMSFAFHHGKWGHTYGGPKWGVIADTLVELTKGELTPEMFCDVSFALAHNGGPIFNKGMFYSQYGQDFGLILDVQRGGQIPQYIYSQKSSYVSSETQVFRASAWDVLGDEFTGEMDWTKVIEAGAINVDVIKDKYNVQGETKAEKINKELGKHVKAMFQVLPDLIIPVTDRNGLEKFQQMKKGA